MKGFTSVIWCVTASRISIPSRAAFKEPPVPGFRRAQPLLHAPAFGHIAGHLHKAAHLSSLVAQGRDDDMRPEGHPILADPPALGLDLPCGHRHLQFVLGPLLRPVFRAIHAREMLADDLIRFVPLHALGPGMPTDDVSRRIEHENGLVLHPLHQQAEARFMLPQRGLRPLALAAALHVAQFAGDRRHQTGQFSLSECSPAPPPSSARRRGSDRFRRRR